MKCILCNQEMNQIVDGWQDVYKCPNCETRLVIDHSDLMSGCMVLRVETWTDKAAQLLSITEYDRTGNPIKKECEIVTLKIPESNPVLQVPISECDIEMFQNLINHNEKFDWDFEDSTGRMINIQFIQEKE